MPTRIPPHPTRPAARAGTPRFPHGFPIDALLSFRAPGVFNPWAERDELDGIGDTAGPGGRLARLSAHLATDPLLLLLGEAAGYQGCHFSGIPFTNEKQLLAGSIPRIPPCDRLTSRPRPWCEPSATIVWGALREIGIAERVVLWNTFAWHPHRPGDRHSNRTPTPAEVKAGEPVLAAVLKVFSGAAVIAVGRVAERTLQSLGVTPACAVRHPAMGGAALFREGVSAAVRRFV